MKPSDTRRGEAVRLVREHVQAGRDADALRAIDGVPAPLRGDPEILFLRAVVLERQHRFKDAIEFAKQSLSDRPRPEPMLLIAGGYRGLGQTDRALEWCDRARQAQANPETVSFLRGKILEAAGRTAEARAELEPIALAYDASAKPYPLGLAVEWSKVLVQDRRHAEAIALIDRTLTGADLPVPARIDQLYLKAKAADRTGNFDLAFASAAEANRLGQLDFDPGLYDEQVSALIEIWSRERVRDFPLAACDSELPVFVAGMPRSGTSLIDQIIDAHPLASGVGELSSVEQFALSLSREYDADLPPPECFGSMGARRWTRFAQDYVREVRRLAPPGVQRVVNKALGNNKLVGLIARLFPRTRIIHAIRDPRDTAISCFMGGFNNRMHPWTTRLEWASTAWELSRRLMEHWKATLDVPILDVHYERLVADPEPEFRRLIKFLGLEWDPKCLEFHTTRRTVRTLSYDQVNRPLYTTSVGRHAHYAKHLVGVRFPAYDAG